MPSSFVLSAALILPAAEVVAALMLITGAVPPDETIGAVPVTPVTVPLPVPAPMAVLKLAAVSTETVLSALNRGNVMAEGLVKVNKLLPTVVAPKLVRAPAAVVLPVPPFATANVPAIVIVPLVVTGPPLKVKPVVPPDASTLVTVPVPLMAVPLMRNVPVTFTSPFTSSG